MKKVKTLEEMVNEKTIRLMKRCSHAREAEDNLWCSLDGDLIEECNPEFCDFYESKEEALGNEKS